MWGGWPPRFGRVTGDPAAFGSASLTGGLSGHAQGPVGLPGCVCGRVVHRSTGVHTCSDEPRIFPCRKGKAYEYSLDATLDLKPVWERFLGHLVQDSRVNPYYGWMNSQPDTRTVPSLPVAATDPPRQWVPVLRMSEEHRPALKQHLQALGHDDRYLRFGYLASDEQIGRYVDGLDFERDELFGVFNRQLDLIAAAHLAVESAVDDAPAAAEFGISVSANSRRNGIGKRLFEHAQMRARLKGISILHIHALAENQPMLRLLHSAGARIERLGSDAEAVLPLPEAHASTRMESWVEAGAAGLDYTAKRLSRMRAVLSKTTTAD